MADREALAKRRRFYAVEIAAAARRWGWDDPRVEDAFATVPREACLPAPPWRIFAPGGFADETTWDAGRLYDDVLVVLDRWRGINNGQPSLHAAWMMAVAPRPGESVAQIGAGSGYYTAILAELVGPAGRVAAYEIEPRLAALARTNLAAWPQVRVHAATGLTDLPPVDVIYVAAGLETLPAAWLRVLPPGGRLVMPWQPDGEGATLLVERAARGFRAVTSLAVRFIPCVGAFGMATPKRALSGAMAGTRSVWLRADRAPDASALVETDEVWFSSDEVA